VVLYPNHPHPLLFKEGRPSPTLSFLGKERYVMILLELV